MRKRLCQCLSVNSFSLLNNFGDQGITDLLYFNLEIAFRCFSSDFGASGKAQWWEHSPPTSMAWVHFPDSMSYVGWVCCWFLSLLHEVYLWVLRKPALLNPNSIWKVSPILVLCTKYRAVTKISSCRVNTTSRRGIKQLVISFGSIFLLFSYESSRGTRS